MSHFNFYQKIYNICVACDALDTWEACVHTYIIYVFESRIYNIREKAVGIIYVSMHFHNTYKIMKKKSYTQLYRIFKNCWILWKWHIFLQNTSRPHIESRVCHHTCTFINNYGWRYVTHEILRWHFMFYECVIYQNRSYFGVFH